ncbi:unnamed protein product, partial [Rotaria magnacalcarata]
DCIIATTEYELPSPSLVNEIKLDGCLFIAYYDLFTKQLAGSQQDLNKIKLYLGFKDNFVTYHSLIYSKRFSCRLLKTNVSGRPYRSQRFAQEEKKFCCIVYIDEPSKYSIVETKRLIDMDENGYGSIKELGKHYAVHVEQTGTRESMERYGQLLEKALQSQMHEDIPSDCEDWALKNGKMNGSKHCRTTTASPSKSTINQQLASPSQNRIALRNVAFGEIPSSPGYVLHQRAPSCTSKNDSLNHEQSNNCAQDTTTSDDDSYFLHDVGEEVSSDEELDVTVKSSWNLKTSATGGSKSKKGLVKQKETSTPKRFRLLINNDDDNAHDDHLNLQHIFDYVKQINSNVLKLQKHQQHVTITLDRLEKILNTLCNNQKRLAKSLSKHKIPITLENDNQSVHTDDERSDSQDGKYVKSDGSVIDLLSVHGNKQKTIKYALKLIDILFTEKLEFQNINVKNADEEPRIKCIYAAVKQKFNHSTDEMSFVWPPINDSILSKRRNQKRSKASISTNVNDQTMSPIPISNGSNTER